MSTNYQRPGGGYPDPKPPRPQGQGWSQSNQPPSRLTEDWLNWLKEKIKFEKLDPDIFSTVAEHAAKEVHTGKTNKRTQLRHFYDELTMWNDRVEQEPGKYQELAPFIKMLKAKVVYAESRRHVDKKFTDLLTRCLDEIKDPKTLRHAKVFLEAFMGFYRQYDSNPE